MAVPGIDGWDAVVSLGGVMGAYGEEAHPFLADEKLLLADAVEAGLPVPGICLGCQLLADTRPRCSGTGAGRLCGAWAATIP
jgi:GMP synthase (glutamine-hydrolysing)